MRIVLLFPVRKRVAAFFCFTLGHIARETATPGHPPGRRGRTRPGPAARPPATPGNLPRDDTGYPGNLRNAGLSAGYQLR